MRNFGFTWWVCQLVRAAGFLFLVAGLYSFLPGVPFPRLVDNMPRPIFGAWLVLGSIAIVMTAESWLVWFQTERNTAEIADRLRRVESLLELRARGKHD